MTSIKIPVRQARRYFLFQFIKFACLAMLCGVSWADEDQEEIQTRSALQKLETFLSSTKAGQARGEVYRVEAGGIPLKVGEFRAIRGEGKWFRFEFKAQDCEVSIAGEEGQWESRSSYREGVKFDTDSRFAFGRYAGVTARCSTIIPMLYLEGQKNRRLVELLRTATLRGAVEIQGIRCQDFEVEIAESIFVFTVDAETGELIRVSVRAKVGKLVSIFDIQHNTFPTQAIELPAQ